MKILALVLSSLIAFADASAQTSKATAKKPAKPSGAAALMKEGRDLYRKGSLGEALLKFEEAEKAGAADGEMFYQMGFLYKTVRSDDESSRKYMTKAAPLLEKSLDAASTPAPFYYLSAIEINELSDSSKGTAAAQRGIALVEKGKFSARKDGESLFQIGRLYSLTGKQDKAAGWYENAFAAFAAEKTPNKQYQLTTAEQLANYYRTRQEADKAQTWLEKLIELDPSRERERLTAGMNLVKMGRYDDALKMFDGFTNDDLATEANYLSRIIRKYIGLDKPVPPEGTSKLDDAGLQAALEKSAATLSDLRVKEDEAVKDEPPAELPFKWVTSKTGVKAKTYPRVYPPPGWEPKDPNNPTQEELDYLAGIPPSPPKPPPPPPSPGRIAAEKEFFSLLIETVKRGKMVREMALTRGMTSLIYR